MNLPEEVVDDVRKRLRRARWVALYDSEADVQIADSVLA